MRTKIIDRARAIYLRALFMYDDKLTERAWATLKRNRTHEIRMRVKEMANAG